MKRDMHAKKKPGVTQCHFPTIPVVILQNRDQWKHVHSEYL